MSICIVVQVHVYVLMYVHVPSLNPTNLHLVLCLLHVTLSSVEIRFALTNFVLSHSVNYVVVIIIKHHSVYTDECILFPLCSVIFSIGLLSVSVL